MSRLAALALAIAASACAVGCQKDAGGPLPPPSPPPPPGPPLASDPVSEQLPGNSGASFLMTATADVDVAYIALPPGSAPDGRVATIRNLRTGDSILVAVAEGGFDPAAIPAIAGDNVGIVVRDGSGNVVFQPPVLVVSARRPPIVVRTNPPPRKRDVPLNTHIVIVFSEPIDAATLTGTSLELRRGSSLVTGSVVFRDSDHVTALFIPTEPLAPATTYTLAVSQEIRDLDGDLLETPVTVEFTTATSGGYEEYFVDATAPLSGDQVGDSVVIDHTVRVLDGDGVGIEGAIIRFRVSTGHVVPDVTTSGLGGLTTGQWTFAGVIGVFPTQATAELSACASNSPTRCDQYWPILVIGFNPP